MSALSVADFAGVISAVSAAIAAFFSFRTVAQSRATSREQQAIDVIRNYLQLAIEHPDLSTGGGKATKQEKYEWFVSFVLIMAQTVLRAYPKSSSWRKLMHNQLSFNAEELRVWKNAEPEHFKLYGPDVERLVEEVLMASKS
jgi:menaquinone-dependent protoporphyrinogen IX oxidase